MAEMSHPEVESGFTQANVMDNEKTVYEVGYHVVPTIPEAQVGAVVDRIREALQAGEFVLIGEEYPKRMTLAYRIERSVSGKREKYTESYFGWFKFEGEQSNIPALSATLRGVNDVLRYLIIETVREAAPAPRAVFSSDRLEGETIKKMNIAEERQGEVSQEEIDKSIEAITG